MALAPRLEVRQSQSLVMTPQMQQAVKLLQMSSLDLADYVAAQVEANPLLEFVPRASSSAAGSGRGPAGDDADALAAVAAETSLWEHLAGQVREMRLAPAVAEAALIVVDELEDDGYLRVPMEEVATRHRLRLADVVRGLAVVQSCEPAGVGARGLAECLALQLREKNRLDPAMQELLRHLKLVAAGRHGELQALCGVDAEDIADMLAELRALDPKPGARFAPSPVQMAVPDVYVSRDRSGGLTVELNADALPRVLVNNIYAAGVRAEDETARAFISECRANASWLVRSLEQRARTMLKVSSEIARHQEGFFGGGVGRLRPLTQRAVAEQVGLHESTVSRVTAGKFLSCGHGLYELRFFFTSALHSLSGGEDHSAAAVQERIRQLVAAESSERPLSDDRLVGALNREGIDIARRTVAKYREGMGIPSSVQRRKRRVSQGAT